MAKAAKERKPCRPSPPSLLRGTFSIPFFQNVPLPFFAFLDGKGRLIVNSKISSDGGPPGRNIGYPSAPQEIDSLLTMMRKAAPKIAEEDLKVMETALRTQKKSPSVSPRVCGLTGN